MRVAMQRCLYPILEFSKRDDLRVLRAATALGAHRAHSFPGVQIPRKSPTVGVTPKTETGENIPIRNEWSVDEAISALDVGTEAPGSGTHVQLPAREVSRGDRDTETPVI